LSHYLFLLLGFQPDNAGRLSCLQSIFLVLHDWYRLGYGTGTSAFVGIITLHLTYRSLDLLAVARIPTA